MHKAMVAMTTMLLASLAGCTDDGPTESSAVICTNLGAIGVELYVEDTPAHAKNFIELAKSGYYDGVSFHRIITDFMMQGGDPEGTGGGGETWDGSKLPDETSPDIPHDKPGLLSMANRGGDPTTGSSQFFITFAPTAWLDGKHVVFGEVTRGMEVVEEVNEIASSRGGTPQVEVYMQTVLVGQDASACPAADGLPAPVEPFACPLAPTRTPNAGVDADLITPGLFCITHPEDRSLVWARHYADGDVAITWELTGAGGGALPDGWTAAFDDQSASLGSHKSNAEAAHTMLRVTVPEGTSGTFELELHTGQSVTPITAVVDLRHERITAAGDSANVNYAGRCASDGQEFDSGTFPLTLGGGRAITGFDLGLIGHGENEDVMIHIPAPLAYGYDGPVCAGDNADLIFDVTVTKF